MDEEREFKVSISVKEVYDLIVENEDAHLIEKEIKDFGDNKFYAYVIYEKYYMRVKNRVSLIVLIDNANGFTNVKAIGSGGGTGMFSKFDWGAGDNFEIDVLRILKDYIIK